MKKNILKHSLLGLILISGFFSWYSVYRALRVPGASPWLVPILWFSLYAIAICLAAVLIRLEIVLEITIFVSVLLSLIFALSLWHFAIIIFCAMILLSAMRNIGNDLDLNIKISLWKSLHTGKFKLLVALAVIISSQYYFIISSIGGQKVIPKFDLSPIVTKVVGFSLGLINPDFKAIQDQGLTVDQSLMQSIQKNGSTSNSVLDPSLNGDFIDQQIPQNLSADQRAALKQQTLEQISNSQVQLSQKSNELLLVEGRKQLSQIAGYDVTGNEKMSDVMIGPASKKINDIFQTQIDVNSKSPYFPYVLTIVLIVTILSLGSVILSQLWFAIVILIFKIFVRFGLVEVRTITVEREMIA